MPPHPPSAAPDPTSIAEDTIDFSELLGRLRRGLISSLGLLCLGVTAGIVLALLAALQQPAVATMRVTFSFPGFERGQYPNGTKFQADDLRAPDVIAEAIRRTVAGPVEAQLASRIRGALSITGFVSSTITRERDRLRAAGQDLPTFVPDEYEISLSLPRRFPLDVRQRELLLAEIVSVFHEKFRRTHVELPPDFGNAFVTLRTADFVEYELVLTRELQSLRTYLEQKMDSGRDREDHTAETRLHAGATKRFRSPTNHLSFQDLLKEVELFTQIRLNDVLGQIYIHGLSKDRRHALLKMDYYLRTLEDRERQLTEEESVVTALLTKTHERAQNYVLAAKAQNPSGAQPMIDQGFIDALITNDAYNFLIRRALEAGLEVKRVQADRARLLERRERMESFARDETASQDAAIASTQQALAELEKSYLDLLAKVRVVLEDYAAQEFADAIRISLQPRTRPLAVIVFWGALTGAIAGFALGLGLSLLRPTRRPA